jgi:hypothetical protein
MPYSDRPGKNVDKPWRRTSKLEIYLRPGERADLDVIGEKWGIPAGAVGWVIIAGYLAKCRRRRLKDLPRSQSPHSSSHKAVMAYEIYEEAYAEQESRDSQEAGTDEDAGGGDSRDRNQRPGAD